MSAEVTQWVQKVEHGVEERCLCPRFPLAPTSPHLRRRNLHAHLSTCPTLLHEHACGLKGFQKLKNGKVRPHRTMYIPLEKKGGERGRGRE